MIGLRRAKPLLGHEPAGDGAVAEQFYARLAAEALEPHGGAAENRVLALVGGDGDACVDELSKLDGVEVRGGDEADEALFLKTHELTRYVDHARHRIVPPVELNCVEPLDAEAPEASRDDVLDISRRHVRKVVEVGHELRVNLRQAKSCLPALADDAAEEVLDARVDVGAVEGVESHVDEAVEGAGRVGEIERTLERVARGKLPAAVDDARHVIVFSNVDSVHEGRLGHDHVLLVVRLPDRSGLCAQRHDGAFGVREDAFCGPTDPELRSAVGIGTGDERIGRHPVVRGGGAFLGGQ